MITFFKGQNRIVSGISFVLILVLHSGTFAQKAKDSISRCPVKSLPEVFQRKDSVLVLKPIKNSFFLVIPLIGSQPATGFVYGAVGQYTFKGKNPEDKYSAVNLGINYSEKKQLIVNFKNNVMLKDNRIFLSGDWRYYIFSQDNYGLGSEIVPPIWNNKYFILSS